MMVKVTDVHSVADGKKFQYETRLVTCVCPHCFILHAIPERLNDAARAWPGDQPKGWTIHCPMGHSWVYKGRTLEQQLEGAKNDAARARAQRDQAQASARAHKGVATKAKKKLAKVTAGVCPVDGCHRHFTNLERHIATKHPDHAK